jgi:putative hydrolase of the HAD superfamily
VSDLEPTEVENRRAARDRALELLYEAEAKSLPVGDVLAALPLPPAELAVELVEGVASDAGRIDEVVARLVAPRWTLARLAAVDRAVLRLGTYELLHRPDRSQAVIINEAVVLARRYGSDDSPRFVNGVLSAVAAEARGGPAGAAAPGAEGDGEPVRPAEALVVDLDGVIRRWAPDALASIEREFGLPSGAVASAAFEPARLAAAMDGTSSYEDWCAAIGEAVAAEHPVDAEAVAKAFGQTAWDLDHDVLALVDEVRAGGVPVALLSNASTRLADDLRSSGIDARFDAVVGSADLGVAKPHADAFLAAAERLGVGPAACLMVDDRAENVAGARATGMQAHLFTGADTLREALVAARLLPAE